VIIFSIIIFQFYSSYIVGSLLTKPQKTINSIKDLINSNLKVGIEDISYNRDYFETTTDEDALELFDKKLKRTKVYYSLADGIKLLKAGGFAFHCDVAYGYGLIKDALNEREICDLHEMPLYAIRPLPPSVPKGNSMS
jgi:ionotropic glutamate receptor